MQHLLSQFALLSEAGQLAVVGAGLWVLAGFCGVMDYRRGKRRNVARLEQRSEATRQSRASCGPLWTAARPAVARNDDDWAF
ncbi:MAG: hypothetical protein MUF47_05645 [Porphyrobacter sp.]|nr:hypothetical protein [Porphyrobacter sp.]